MNKDFKIIAVDFDGTLCTNAWPEIGEPNEGLIRYILEQQALNNKTILWTCRTGELLEQAIEWCREQGLIFDAVNENLPEVIESMGGDTRKIYADEYIDDKMLNQFGYDMYFAAAGKRKEKFDLILDICKEALNEYGNIEDTLDVYHVEYSLKDMLENSVLVEDLLDL